MATLYVIELLFLSLLEMAKISTGERTDRVNVGLVNLKLESLDMVFQPAPTAFVTNL